MEVSLVLGPQLLFHNENQGGTIDRVLSLHKLQSIATFRATAWIRQGIKLRNGSNSPWSATCETSISIAAIDLRLESCGVVPDIGGAVFFPRLKNLHLIQVQYETDELLPHLLSGCPVLEELSVELFIDYSSCKISSHTVKMLYIKCGELTALIEADIYICNNVKPEDGFLYSRSLMEFIDRLHNVNDDSLTLLSLCLPSLLIIDSVFSTWKSISFHNLTKLELTTDCYFLSKLHENADNLEILILSEVFEEIKGWTELQQVPASLLSHLRTIKLDLYVGKDHRFKLMKYLLSNARILERMQIVYPSRALPEVDMIPIRNGSRALLNTDVVFYYC
ncbi:PREDICTED: putative FBD-associated F-box protein At3g50710 [Erythranthe guttata]|uniref:putative FBD-associated F-box protein At3g50710 n=1 Tax=Erythranthe guttata TaxID=4155 RepID=UPI00064DBBA5|nr:PREDICTED: putative FBD-associated F-box protein At3g50710 [Erythranthe guttata]|eukprot:XP_012841486.1 PREDICTED: putative FBD-associated F-box protein At3g50710 [Erythranthe guttata]